MFESKTYNQKMDKTIEVFNKELSSLRTGRANANMLDLVNFFITSAVSFPETLITAIPDIPDPDDKAYIVIFN